MSDPDPLLGAFFVQRGDHLLGRLIRLITRSDVNHAGVYIGDGQVVEALSPGALAGSAPADAIWSRMPLTDAQRLQIAREAVKMVGTPYGWVDVICLGLMQYGIRLPPVIRRVRRKDYLFCSELVDEAYRKAGVHLFDDGRASLDVTPGDLYRLIQAER